jgi:hypothetical protein
MIITASIVRNANSVFEEAEPLPIEKRIQTTSKLRRIARCI